MIFCKDCKWLKTFPGRGYNDGADRHVCRHPSCYKTNPLTGVKDIRPRESDYEFRNANYDCADFEQKPPPAPKVKRKRWWRS